MINEAIEQKLQLTYIQGIRGNAWSFSFKFLLSSRFESGTHPREPVIDLLTLTQLHTASLEDHAKHLTKYENIY